MLMTTFITINMSDFSHLCSEWWAQIKYLGEFLDYVPVSQISECDDNLMRSKQFQPKHLTDFVPDRYYLVQTDKFKCVGEEERNIFYALIGNLAESEECVRESTEKIEWPAMHEHSLKLKKNWEKWEEMEEVVARNNTEKCKTIMPFWSWKGNKPFSLTSLLSELKSEMDILEKSFGEQLVLMTGEINKIKKRIYTDLCICSTSFNDILLCILRLVLNRCFCTVEKGNDKLKMAFRAKLELMRYLCTVIENCQKERFPVSSSILIYVQGRIASLKSGELSALQLINTSLTILMDTVIEMEEELFGLNASFRNIEHSEHVYEAQYDHVDDDNVDIIIDSDVDMSETEDVDWYVADTDIESDDDLFETQDVGLDTETSSQS